MLIFFRLGYILRRIWVFYSHPHFEWFLKVIQLSKSSLLFSWLPWPYFSWITFSFCSSKSSNIFPPRKYAWRIKFSKHLHVLKCLLDLKTNLDRYIILVSREFLLRTFKASHYLLATDFAGEEIDTSLSLISL